MINGREVPEACSGPETPNQQQISEVSSPDAGRLFLFMTGAFAPRFLQTRLTTTPLRFANPSPPSGWIEDFHLQAVEYG